ncbi:MAG: TIGR04076 family protein [Candidatus Bathyarchaeota archaeon]|nr:TIGR04076 family protein [Candidatus Bathyarchaeota archaeon]
MRFEELLEIEVCEIRGKCPVHKVGDRIVIDGPRIVLEETDAVCVHALSSLLHYNIALDEDVDPRKLGLSKERSKAYIQCPDPGEPYTSGGTVIFKCCRIEG